jgi:hypothetical protein
VPRLTHGSSTGKFQTRCGLSYYRADSMGGESDYCTKSLHIGFARRGSTHTSSYYSAHRHGIGSRNSSSGYIFLPLRTEWTGGKIQLSKERHLLAAKGISCGRVNNMAKDSTEKNTKSHDKNYHKPSTVEDIINKMCRQSFG